MTPATCALPDLGLLAIRGVDALRFLQGQLSSDTRSLRPGVAQLAGLHNPQGRVIALLRLVLSQPDCVFAVLPAELLPLVLGRLGKFVLRAKLSLADESAAWQVFGIARSGAELPLRSIEIALGDAAGRTLAIVPAIEHSLAGTLPREVWRGMDVEAGLPQVYAATSESFVAQMLNLDLLGGIAFDKGCYTGQEVIARAHYRGRVKRRLQRFATRAPAALAPGFHGRFTDGRSFTVVESVRLPDGRAEFLAVAPLADAPGETEGAAELHSARDAAPMIECTPLPLPYALPTDR